MEMDGQAMRAGGAGVCRRPDGAAAGPDGNRPTVGRLLREVAARLHCQLPRNPGSVYARLRVSMESQYSRRQPMRARYAYMLERGEERPVRRFVSA